MTLSIYHDRAMDILEEGGMAHERSDYTVYTVRLGGELLYSRDTAKLRKMIEEKLRDRDEQESGSNTQVTT